jgi:nitrate/TMAO reductase-like tetraheme cytochrome c subunit
MNMSSGLARILRCCFAATMIAWLLIPGSATAAVNPADRRCTDCHRDIAEQVESVPSVHSDQGIGCVSCHRGDFARRVPHRGERAPVACWRCHDGASERYQSGPHARRDESGRLAASCWDCHGTHDVLPAGDPASRVQHLKVSATCAGCHSEEGMKGPHRYPEQHGRWVAVGYADGIHGQAISRGSRAAPSCVTCHGAHPVRHIEESESPVAPANVAGMCGSCHEGTRNAFFGGRHGRHRQAGGTETPGCVDCHSPHRTLPTSLSAWKLAAIRECGSCHEERALSYRDTFHGKVTSLGFVRVASCADCHGAHEVFPRADPRSPIAPENLVDTCGRCHAGANAKFVLFNPHANRHDREGEPLLYWSNLFMHGLLIGVFGLFGLHTLLWA